jgi:hypothetical protein
MFSEVFKRLPDEIVLAINLVRVLHFHKLGMPVADIARDCDITMKMARTWIAQYGKYADIVWAEHFVTEVAFKTYEEKLPSGAITKAYQTAK